MEGFWLVSYVVLWVLVVMLSVTVRALVHVVDQLRRRLPAASPEVLPADKKELLPAAPPELGP